MSAFTHMAHRRTLVTVWHRVVLSCREALGRTGTSLLAQGNDGVTLQSEVKLLDEQEGQYMIGSVQFTKPQKRSRPGSTTPTADSDATGSSRPSLDSVMGSARGQALLDSQVGLHNILIWYQQW